MRKTLAFSVLLALSLATAFAVPAEPARTVTGTVARVQASARTVAVTLTDGTEAVFVWNDETKISGTLTPGAKVTIRYTPGTGATNLAQQITVARS
jgi:hypothetical protein